MDQAAVTTMQDDDAPVRTTLRDGVGTIELSRPAVFNCLSQRMLSEIGAAVAAFERDGARAVLIVADGKNFCTGAALDEVEAVRGGEAELRDYPGARPLRARPYRGQPAAGRRRRAGTLPCRRHRAGAGLRRGVRGRGCAVRRSACGVRPDPGVGRLAAIDAGRRPAPRARPDVQRALARRAHRDAVGPCQLSRAVRTAARRRAGLCAIARDAQPGRARRDQAARPPRRR